MSQEPTSTDELLQAGSAALRAGERERARRLLMQAVRRDPTSERGWLLLAGALSDPAQRRDCLERVLQLNPQHPLALRGLRELGGGGAGGQGDKGAGGQGEGGAAAIPPAAASATTRPLAPAPQPAPSAVADAPPAAASATTRPLAPAPQPAPSAVADAPPAAASATTRPLAPAPQPPPSAAPPPLSPADQVLATLRSEPAPAASVDQVLAALRSAPAPAPPPPAEPPPAGPTPTTGITSPLVLPPGMAIPQPQRRADRIVWALALALGLILMLASAGYVVALLR